MKHANRLTISFFLLLAAFGSLALPVAAQSSEEISQEKIEAIKDHCVSAQSAVQRTQKSDLVTRTNRGRSYEYLLSLMASLNSRIALNKLSQPRMVEVASLLQSNFESFHSDYTSYTISVDQLLRINCENEPEKFYKALEEVREKRAALATGTVEMRKLIDEYSKLVTALQPKDGDS